MGGVYEAVFNKNISILNKEILFLGKIIKISIDWLDTLIVMGFKQFIIHLSRSRIEIIIFCLWIFSYSAENF